MALPDGYSVEDFDGEQDFAPDGVASECADDLEEDDE